MRAILGHRSPATLVGKVVAAANLILLTLVTPAESAFPGANGKIAFESERDGVDLGEIYTMNADGTAQTRLTTNSVIDDQPNWSSDGTKIAFPTRRDGNLEIYAMNADGTSPTRLTTNSATDEDPAWSPDGTRIAFQSTRNGIEEIYVMNADGSNQTRVTNNSVADYSPNWSPDGRKLAFTSERDGFPEIYTMNVDGTAPTRLTNNGAIEDQPNWSPDGTKIAFASERDGNLEIYTMNADGTAQTRRTNVSAIDEDPAWSPDGTKIAFQSLRTGNEEVFTMNADGTGQADRSNNAAVDASPDWQPLPGSAPAAPYEAPKFAAPLRFSLVPIFRQCGTGANPANGQHASPFSGGSCLPPSPQGVAHFGPQAKGTAWISVIYGDTNAVNGDQADATIRLDLNDVRTGGGADYDPNPAGADATFFTRLRFTDRSNGVSGTDPGTTTDYDFSVPFGCTSTADPAVGSNCLLDTSADAVTPGIVKENRATVVSVFRLRLADSGSNGIRGDGDDALFGTEGYFVP
jgi:WD40 repeat protein